jgi:hypothetical protein
MAKEAAPAAHLSDLFRKGEEVTIIDDSEIEYKIWVVRPSSLQQEESREKANGKMARMKLAALNKEGDRYVSIKLSFAEVTDRDALVDMRLQYEENDARDLAFNEVLFAEDSEWAKDDKYMGLVTAITARHGDIAKYNKEMMDADSEDRIDETEDEELLALEKEQAKFRLEVDDRLKELIDGERELLIDKTEDELRDELMDLALDLEARMMWYEAFKNRMLYYACRYNDDRPKFYFSNVDDVLEVPEYARSQLYRAYERVEQGSEDLKNLLSLPSS